MEGHYSKLKSKSLKKKSMQMKMKEKERCKNKEIQQTKKMIKITKLRKLKNSNKIEFLASITLTILDKSISAKKLLLQKIATVSKL